MKPWLAILVVLATAPAAHASWTLDLRTGLSAETVGPVFAGDGSLVFGTTGENGVSLWRATGEGAAPQPLVTLPSTTASGTTLFAAGNGYGYQAGYLRGTRLIVQPDFAKPPVTVADELGYASTTCPRLPGRIAGSASAVLVIPTCVDATQVGTPWIYDVATGATKLLDNVSWNADPRIAGDFATGRGPYEMSELNWRTGQIVRDRLPIALSDVLLPDGSIVRLMTNQTMRSALDGTETPLPVAGYSLAPAGTGFRTFLDGYGRGEGDRDDRELRIWTPEGQLAGAFDHVPENTATDTSRVAFLWHTCLTTRLHVWEAGAASPPRLLGWCARPAIGRIEVGASTARAPLSCPAGTPGCAGFLRVLAPRGGPGRLFVLAPGERQTIPLLSGLSRRACAELSRRPRWRLQLDQQGQTAPEATILHRGRRALCGAP